jgi:hypothetical protein
MMRYTVERGGNVKMEGKTSPEWAKCAVFPGKIFKAAPDTPRLADPGESGKPHEKAVGEL